MRVNVQRGAELQHSVQHVSVYVCDKHRSRHLGLLNAVLLSDNRRKISIETCKDWNTCSKEVEKV